MEVSEIPIEKSYVDLSVDERRKLLDELVLKPLIGAGKPAKEVYNQGDSYRGYRLHDQDPRDLSALHNLQIATEMVRTYPGFAAKGFIADHLEVLNFWNKIHLQPTPGQVPEVIEALVILLINEEEVFQSVDAFKIITTRTHLSFVSGQPYIVVYLTPGVPLTQVRPYFIRRFDDYPPAQRPLAFNQQDGPILFTAIGDGLFKQFLSFSNMIDLYYDHQTNYAFPRPLPKFSENLAQRLIRLGLEKTIKV